MRCRCCDDLLNEEELRQRDATDDTCFTCLTAEGHPVGDDADLFLTLIDIGIDL